MRAVAAALGVVVIVCVAMLNVGGAQVADASFHQMRVYAVMGGLDSNLDVQYVELRMTSGGQTQVGGKVICFFDANGAPSAQFKFASNHAETSANQSSILVGSPAFDGAWEHSPDELFGPSTVTSVSGTAFVTAPVLANGKVAFGTDSATEAALMCGAGFAVIDSVAYGPSYTGTVNFGTKAGGAVGQGAADVLKITGNVCNPCARDNSTDYAVVSASVPANNPRNNKGESAALGAAPSVQGDADCDGDVDGNDGLAALIDAANMGSPQCAHLSDINCDQAHGVDDAIEIFRHAAELPRLVPLPGGCAALGDTVTPP